MSAFAPMLTLLREHLGARAAWLRSQWAHLSAQPEVVTHAEVDWLLQGEERWGAAKPGLPPIEEPPTLAELGDAFGLTPLERWTLFACLAPELDPGLERLYAYAQDNPQATAPTPALLLSLFGLQPDALAQFLPTGSLRRWRLVKLEPTFASQPLALRPLALPDRITGFLLGDQRPEERLDGLMGPVQPALVAPSHERLLPTIAQQLRRGPVNLIGPPGAGLPIVAEASSQSIGLPLWSLDLDRLAKAPDGVELARLAAREARLQGATLLIETDGEAEAPLLQQLTTSARPCIVASRERRTGFPVFVPPLTKAEQALLWREHLGRSADTTEIEALVQQFELDHRSIAEIASASTAELRWQLCRERGRRALDGLAERLEGHLTWEDLVLPPETERHLRELVDQCQNRYTVYEGWGFSRRLSRGRGIAALFAGPSGAGKTTAAEVLATELRLDLYRIDLAGMVSKYIGETEKNLRRIFDAAEQAGAILFFDEADALFGKRSEVKDAHDRYANIEIDYLLQRMEAYRGVTILATNLREALDVAFLRRLRFLIDFPFPDGEERVRLWQRAFPAEAQLDSLDYRWLARLELAGGPITNIAVNAAFLAAAERSPIRMVHVVHALERELVKMDKPIRPSEFGPYASLLTR